MIYDYGGFPPHTYQIHYDAPGAPELAQRVQGLIEAARAVLDNKTVAPHAFQTEDGRRYLRRLLAYRSERNEISGVIVTFTDITDSQLALDAVSVARQDLSESRALNEKLRLLSVALATAEGLPAHALSAQIRLGRLPS